MSDVMLVTGAAGFIGRHLCRKLAESGHTVIGVGRGRQWNVTERHHWGISQWLEGDITQGALSQCTCHPTAIFHCAGSGDVKLSTEDPMVDYRSNVLSTLEVLEWQRRRCSNVPLVLLSSAAVYGRTDTLPITEAQPFNPISPYGWHKAAAENLLREYAQVFGIRSVVVRLFSIYGEGLRKQLLWDACQKMRNGDFLFGGTGDELRDWLHIEDAVNLLALAPRHTGTEVVAVNGGSGRAVKVKDIVTLIARIVAPGVFPVFSGNVRPGNPAAYEADVSQARQWGWEPNVDWCSGVDRYASWYLSEKV